MERYNHEPQLPKIDIEGLPEYIQGYEDAEFLYLWCTSCLMVQHFSKHASLIQLQEAANTHQHVFNDCPPAPWEKDWNEYEKHHFD